MILNTKVVETQLPDFLRMVNLKEYLEELFHHRVDLGRLDDVWIHS